MAYEEYINQISSGSHRDALHSALLVHGQKHFSRSLTDYPWAVDKKFLPLLQQFGINVTGLGVVAHPHPVHKIIETHILLEVWSRYATEESTVLYMKESKFHRIREKNENFKHLHNRHHLARDRIRYQTNNFPTINTRVAFMQDALMYFTPGQILTLFKDSPKLNTLFATLVVPAETAENMQSLMPDLYQLEYKGQDVIYSLEGSRSSSYVQPKEAVDWLKLNLLHYGDLQLTITLLESFGPVHSLMITRNKSPELPTINAFTVPDSVVLPNPDLLTLPLQDRLVPRPVYEQLFQYVRAVRSLRKTDPAGFIRTQRGKAEFAWVSNAAWELLGEFALATFSYQPDVSYLRPNSLLSSVRLFVRRNRPSWTYWETYCPQTRYKIHAELLHPKRWDLTFTLQARQCPPERLALDPILQYAADLFSKPKTGTILRTFAPVRQNITDQSAHQIKSADEITSSNVRANERYALTIDDASKHMIARPEEAAVRSKNFTDFFTFQLYAGCGGETAALMQQTSFLLSFEKDPERAALHRINHPKAYLIDQPAPPAPLPCEAAYADPPWVEIKSHVAYFKDILRCSPKLKFFGLNAPADFKPFQVSGWEHKIDQFPSGIFIKYTRTAENSESTLETASQPTSDKSVDASNESFVKVSSPVTPEPLLDQIPQIVTSPQESTPLNKDQAPDLKRDWVAMSENQVTVAEGDLLSRDDSACGEVAPYYLIHGLPEVPELSFPTRRRSGPCALPYPKRNDCLLQAYADATGLPKKDLWFQLSQLFPNSQIDSQLERDAGFTSDHLAALAWALGFRVNVIISGQDGVQTYGPENASVISLAYAGSGHQGHWTARAPNEIPTSFPSIRGGSKKIEQEIMAFRDSNGHMLPFLKIHTYKVNRARAKNLASNIKNEFDGLLAKLCRVDPAHHPPETCLALDSRAEFLDRPPVKLIHLSGFPGCGKTHPVGQYLQGSRHARNFRISVPTNNLRGEWKRALNLPGNQAFRISTWETALVGRGVQVLVIDEIYKMPNGYLDLALLADLTIDFVILLGDPCQTGYASLNPNSTNKTIMSEISYLQPYRDLHCAWSYRVPQRIANIFGVAPHSEVAGFVSTVLAPDMRYPVLVTSQDAAKTLCDQGFQAITFAGAQGMTFESPVQIFVTRNLKLIHASAAFVALTRSKKGVVFTGDWDLLQRDKTLCPIFTAALEGTQLPLAQLFHNELGDTTLLHAPLLKRRIRGGAVIRSREILIGPAKLDSAYTEDVCSTAPVLKDQGPSEIGHVSTHFLPETRRPLHQDIPDALLSAAKISSVNASEAGYEPVYPGVDYQIIFQQLLPAHDPEEREITFAGERSNQFPWVNVDYECGALPPGLVAPKHSQRTDPLLLQASLAKRLRFRASERPYQITERDEVLGALLYRSLCAVYKRDPNTRHAFDENLFLDCVAQNELAQLTSKTQNTIIQNADRSDPAWPLQAVRIFSKTQHKLNENLLMSDWKACQTLALMHDAVVLLFGPVKKYQRVLEARERPNTLFIYGGKTPFDLRDFAREHLRDGVQRVCNDYTAFDQSQHGEAVVLERLKMQWAGIPEELIRKHVTLKTSVSTQFGPLTCMRLTGEPGTYDDNTDYNLAVLGLEYYLAGVPVFVSGDDSLLGHVPQTRETWQSVQPLLHLQFKKEFSKYGLFCGYYLHAVGAVRSPLTLAMKIYVAEADDSIKDKLACYLSEFVVGHSLGDEFWQAIPPEQILYQCALFDFFCRRASKQLKIALKIGEVPEEICKSLLNTAANWLSYPFYALLNNSARLTLFTHGRRKMRSLDGSLQGVLQHYCQ